MTIRTLFRSTLFVAIAFLTLTACGQPAAATLADIPAYPGATELKPGESVTGSTLDQNNQTDALIRSQAGVGGKTEQKGYALPSETTWDQVQGFYNEKLSAAGWGTNSMVTGIMAQANTGNDLFKTANWQKGSQNVTVVMVTSPTDSSKKELIVSLSSQ